jgi:predicted RNA binding protein with dsRBD fold (UPF0201 family)
MTLDRLEQIVIGYIEADLLPTEDRKKVLLALSNLFPDSKFKEDGYRLIGEVGLSRFKELLEKEEIRAAIEAALDDNLAEDRSFLDLNKTAALVGRVAIDESSPLGKIRLQVPWKKA